jgi:hypothetical protein
LTWPRCQAAPLGHEQNRDVLGPCVFERHRCHREAIGSCAQSLIFGNVALEMALGLKNSEPRCFACYAELRPGPKASAPTGHCCHHLRACGFPAGIADCLARKSSRERAARAKRMFSGPCSRPRDAIAKRSRLYVAFLVTDPHTEFQRLATNSARGGRPQIPTQFDFNIIILRIHL